MTDQASRTARVKLLVDTTLEAATSVQHSDPAARLVAAEAVCACALDLVSHHDLWHALRARLEQPRPHPLAAEALHAYEALDAAAAAWSPFATP